MRISDWSSDVCSSDLSTISRRAPLSLADHAGSHVRLLHWGTEAARRQSRQRQTTRHALAVDARHTGNRRHPRASADPATSRAAPRTPRSEEHTSELQSLMRISYAVFCLKKKNKQNTYKT